MAVEPSGRGEKAKCQGQWGPVPEHGRQPTRGHRDTGYGTCHP